MRALYYVPVVETDVSWNLYQITKIAICSGQAELEREASQVKELQSLLSPGSGGQVG
jgi:hypothetical protein